MVIKVGINGFGRIGRVIFRTCLQNPDIELSAINDPAINIDYICYLIKFDSTHGKFKGNITHTENEINIGGRLIKVFRDKLPHAVPWQVAGVQYVIEASGMFTCLEKSSGHLASDGVKRVIVTAPSVDVPMIILGVNDNKLSAEQKVLSCASSTLYCLAPIVKVLEENYGVTEGFITSIHAMTPSLKPLDGLCLKGKHWRDHRSIHQNIIPATTGSCKALAKIIPQVKDKMTGLAFRVPIVNVSVLDMTVRLDTDTNLQDIIKTVENAGRTFLQNIIKISNEEAVSSDFSGDSHSCILDADSSLQLKPNFYKIICWYENEYSYSCRVLDSIFFSEMQFNKPVRLPCKMTYVRAKITKKQDEVQQTESSAKEMSALECSSEVPKSCTSTVLHQTTCKRKPLLRPAVFLKKPLSAHSSPATAPAFNRDTKKRNELFKIWNDNNDVQTNAGKQNRSSFFHSCVGFGPKQTEITDCMKAQKRLENVKREFSKMVNITEDLLKKSNTNKLQLGNATKSYLEGAKLGANGGSKEFKNVIKLNNSQANSIFDISSDYKDRQSTSPAVYSNEEVRRCSSSDRKVNHSEYNTASTVIRDNNSEYKIASTVRKENNSEYNTASTVRKKDNNSEYNTASTARKENNSEYNIANAVKQIVSNNKPFLISSSIFKPSREKPASFAKQNSVTYFSQNVTAQNSLPAKANDSLKKNCLMNTTMNFKRQMTKTNNYSTDSPSNESPLCAMKEYKEISRKISGNVYMEYVKEKQMEAKITEGAKSPQRPPEKKACNSKDPDPTEKIHYKEFNKYLHKKDYNMRLIDGELQKRNIVLMNDQNQNNSEVNFKSGNMPIKYRETETCSKNLSKQILESLSRKFPGPVMIIPEEGTGCCSPDGTATTISNGNGRRSKPDLYDQLDSASATDSTNSFEINERKSQVIQICDLTNSLEDLGRLDKICRIIEISDELSDKLFSTLDRPEVSGLHEKKWSFRDLCERIQLDEFCKNVFGKSRT